MESQVLLRTFWIFLALAVVGIFFFRIESLKSEESNPEIYIESVSLTISRMLNTEGNVIVEYYLPEAYDIKLQDNEVILNFGGNRLRREFFGDESKLSLVKEETKLILRKNE